MKRLILVLTVVVTAAGVIASARVLEQATWVLTTGERVTGLVNTHTDERINIARNQFAVGMPNGQEREVRVDQVAVIEFVSGTPSNDEMLKLPASGHMIAMRDGATYGGRLLDLINGEAVRWLHDGGRSEDIPITLAARVYMNPASAKNIYHFNASAPNAPATPPARAGGPVIPNGPGIAVRANVPWTDTGNPVFQGERIKFTPTGQVRWGADADMLCGPDGSPRMPSNSTFPVQNMAVGALVGRVGNGRAFPIGSGTQPIVMPGNGELFLGVNDSVYQDNAGGFRVQIQQVR
jgi:hypothetical protein